ncbi:MAG TPA: hypothetical protein VM674_00070 [Candidatus Acidoferrum sp.]|nr:hypothetical protein [Candidatus Acidoferrum sp.]
MDLTTSVLIAVAIVASVLLQFGERRMNVWRALLPLGIVGWVGVKYLTPFPTAGNDLLFELTGAALGVVTGVIAAVLTGVRRDGQGNVLLTAGVIYAAYWIAIFGARIAVALAATNSPDFDRQLGLFSYQHDITGPAAWTAFFVLQAIMMVGVRTVIVLVRAILVQPRLNQRLAA